MWYLQVKVVQYQPEGACAPVAVQQVLQAVTPVYNTPLLGKQARQSWERSEPKTSEVDLSTFIAKEINTQQSLGLTAILCGLFLFLRALQGTLKYFLSMTDLCGRVRQWRVPDV